MSANSVPEQPEQGEQPENKPSPRKKTQHHTFKSNDLTSPQGLRQLYQMVSKLKLQPQQSSRNLDSIINLIRQWHYGIMPKYSLEMFLDRCQAMEKQKDVQAHLHKMRRVHLGQDNWDEEQQQQPNLVARSESVMGRREQFHQKFTIEKQLMPADQPVQSDDDEEYEALLEAMQRNKSNLLKPQKHKDVVEIDQDNGMEEDSIDDFYVPPDMEDEIFGEQMVEERKSTTKELPQVKSVPKGQFPQVEPWALPWNQRLQAQKELQSPSQTQLQ